MYRKKFYTIFAHLKSNVHHRQNKDNFIYLPLSGNVVCLIDNCHHYYAIHLLQLGLWVCLIGNYNNISVINLLQLGLFVCLLDNSYYHFETQLINAIIIMQSYLYCWGSEFIWLVTTISLFVINLIQLGLFVCLIDKGHHYYAIHLIQLGLFAIIIIQTSLYCWGSAFVWRIKKLLWLFNPYSAVGVLCLYAWYFHTFLTLVLSGE